MNAQIKHLKIMLQTTPGQRIKAWHVSQTKTQSLRSKAALKINPQFNYVNEHLLKNATRRSYH